MFPAAKDWAECPNPGQWFLQLLYNNTITGVLQEKNRIIYTIIQLFKKTLQTSHSCAKLNQYVLKQLITYADFVHGALETAFNAISWSYVWKHMEAMKP